MAQLRSGGGAEGRSEDYGELVGEGIRGGDHPAFMERGGCGEGVRGWVVGRGRVVWGGCVVGGWVEVECMVAECIPVAAVGCRVSASRISGVR